MGRVLVVDDEQGLRDVLEVLIRSKGHVVLTAKSIEEAQLILRDAELDLVITDLRLGTTGDGMDVLRTARSRPDPPEVIIMTAFGTRERALGAVSQGALFYLEKGPHLASDIEVLVAQAINKRRLQAENENLRRALVKQYSSGEVVGKSPAMREVFELVERIAPTRANVLIVGESGTGKERIAKSIHFQSERKQGPFVPLNCGAIPENLIESELFGHVKGAFTGAEVNRRGLFESANCGTLFLDEVGELPLALQPKLLRALQEKKVKPVGASEEIEVDVRVIAATNKDLEAEVSAGRFREDLFFRLNVVMVDLPPLRERREDIPLLAATFLERFARDYQRSVTAISPDAMERLLAFSYPGNVRQLENIIERAVALASSDKITVSELPRDVQNSEAAPVRAATLAPDEPFPDEGIDLEKLVEEFEWGLISRALEKTGGVKIKAADLLGLSFRQFRYKLSKYQRWKAGDEHDDH